MVIPVPSQQDYSSFPHAITPAPTPVPIVIYPDEAHGGFPSVRNLFGY